MSDVGQNPFTPGVKVLYFEGIPPYCGPLLFLGKSLGKAMSILLLPSSVNIFRLNSSFALIFKVSQDLPILGEPIFIIIII